ncbi:MAG TPA: HEAT repeat domain-containing protein [Vicinamibacterales bacterium]|nr:HEAT repeat domain-containing protein [Vicinamibacterales bacterium]
MSTRYLPVCSVLVLAVSFAAAAAAQQPRITNASVEARPAGALAQTVRALAAAQGDVAWIGYAVPVSDRNRVMCCWSSGDGTTYFSGTISGNAPCCGSCRIEPQDSARRPTGAPATAGPIKLEGAERMVVLLRVADRQVERIRVFSEDCELDAGGRPVHWLENVRPADSLALLESFVGVESGRRTRLANAALSAISMHAEPSAAAVIERLARSHEAPSVRGEAIFWLGQMAGAKVASAITEAIANDPDTDVKKRAVFALSQLPRDEGVPLLIDVARRNPNPAVRKQAIFWLGQSKDPRAIDFFAQILK